MNRSIVGLQGLAQSFFITSANFEKIYSLTRITPARNCVEQ